MQLPPGNPAKRDSAREAIRGAAIQLFAEKGFAATSTREICEKAGVTKPVLYYHFGSKEQLYQELILDAFNEYRKELLRASHRGRTPREKLTEILSAMFAFARGSQRLWRMALRMIFAPEKESPAINYVELGHADERLLLEIVREGIRKGEIRGRPQQIAGAICGIATSCILGFLVTGKPPLDKFLARRVIDLLMRGCGSNSTDR